MRWAHYKVVLITQHIVIYILYFILAPALIFRMNAVTFALYSLFPALAGAVSYAALSGYSAYYLPNIQKYNLLTVLSFSLLFIFANSVFSMLYIGNDVYLFTVIHNTNFMLRPNLPAACQFSYICGFAPALFGLFCYCTAGFYAAAPGRY
jgi:hypothetical protein